MKPAEQETVKPAELRRRLPSKRQFVVLKIPGGGGSPCGRQGHAGRTGVSQEAEGEGDMWRESVLCFCRKEQVRLRMDQLE